MPDARAALDRLRTAARNGRLVAICRDNRVRLLGAFGSATRFDRSEASDLDVAAGFLGDRRTLDLLGALTDLCEFDRIDLVVLDQADPLVRARALVGVPLYEHAPGVYATEQMAALTESWDTEWLRRLDRRALAG